MTRSKLTTVYAALGIVFGIASHHYHNEWMHDAENFFFLMAAVMVYQRFIDTAEWVEAQKAATK